MNAQKQQIYLELMAETPVGPIALAASSLGMAAIEIGIRDLNKWADQFKTQPMDPVIAPLPFPAVKQLQAYFEGQRRQFDLPVDWSLLRPFQRKVLEQVAAVPYGETRTYAQIAQKLDRPSASRAVGRANATNPIPIVLPCHRIIGSDGKLRGYRAPEGVVTKAWLLKLEGAMAV